ncbi:DEAD/DEAH box helicase [Allorhizobium sp. BGMRC 0089]|uniref:DEAD/DEAH box helicase n=1 Tax=Allorhizobium sonneratiae TaxID=2934936 RepID=UPI0020345DB4|nr:DEAD/DEAH box helicase [Allorhizobium sonneratiae]MCM2292262.1 DEAD/DEAH box helicase [Allorhizobium sonneratiae]
MRLSDSDIIRSMGKSYFDRGLAYHRSGKVTSINRTGANSFKASVQGSERKPYTQTCSIVTDKNGRASIQGECTCPIGFNCKHVAAAVLTAKARDLLHDAPPRPDGANLKRTTAASNETITMDPAIADWLNALEKASRTLRTDYDSDIGQRLYYIFDQETIRRPATTIAVPVLRFLSVRILKDGSFSTTVSEVDPKTCTSTNPPKYLLDIDLAILKLVYGASPYPARKGSTALCTTTGAEILEKILSTGRARWQSLDGPVLKTGEARSGAIDWQPTANGRLKPHVRLQKEPKQALCLTAQPPLYIDALTGEAGAIDTGLSSKLVWELLNAPSIAIEQVPLVKAHLGAKSGILASLAPPTLQETRIIREKPVPILRLRGDQVVDPEWLEGIRTSFYHGNLPKITVGRADVSFAYGAHDIGTNETGNSLIRFDDQTPVEIRRDRKAEKARLKQLAEYDFEVFPALYALSGPEQKQALGLGSLSDWCRFLCADLDTLRNDGWRIEIAPDFPIELMRSNGDFVTQITESNGIDWFELDIGVLIDGERIDLIDILVNTIQNYQHFIADLTRLSEEDAVIHLRLDERRFLSLPAARLKPYVETLAQLLSGLTGKPASGKLRFSALDASTLAKLESEASKDGAIWQGGDKVRALGARLREQGTIQDVTLPASFNATLRPYQMRGVAWMDFLRSAGLGGILADDMGLGKTIQTLALLALEKAGDRLSSPALVIAPTSLMVNWQREAERFAPDLRVLVLHGNNRKEMFDQIDEADLVLTTYPLIARDHEVLREREWQFLILDEAQTIKNPNAATTKLIHAMTARHRFCLTGTPLENHLGELWSLFHFIAPGFLGDSKTFSKQWRAPIEKHGDRTAAERLSKRVRPFMLRRRKDEVASDLPAKTEIIERIDMDRQQREIYESIRLAMHEKVYQALADKGMARSKIIILDALLKLRQVACDPRLLKLSGKSAEKAGSAKLDRLMDMLEELLAEGRRILLFSQFTSMLDLIRARLDKQGTAYCLLTGETKDRASQVKTFQDGKIPLFLISLKAGGTGLNLTAADTVILYDPWWNPAVENQAIDRAHRIGQDKPVFVHKLVMTGTIEEKIEALKSRKAELAASLFDPEGQPAEAMTEDDLKLLFEAG